jgi:hypothetical protein
MAAIEYGSYYWCVILNGKEADMPAESVHLHADEMTVDAVGSLLFKSTGRRPAGAEPKQQDQKDGDKSSGDNKDQEKDQNEKKVGIVYMAFAPGSWKVVYAAKLQDGSPASVEHWNVAGGNPGLAAVVPANSGAAGYLPRE